MGKGKRKMAVPWRREKENCVCRRSKRRWQMTFRLWTNTKAAASASIALCFLSLSLSLCVCLSKTFFFLLLLLRAFVIVVTVRKLSGLASGSLPLMEKKLLRVSFLSLSLYLALSVCLCIYIYFWYSQKRKKEILGPATTTLRKGKRDTENYPGRILRPYAKKKSAFLSLDRDQIVIYIHKYRIHSTHIYVTSGRMVAKTSCQSNQNQCPQWLKRKK